MSGTGLRVGYSIALVIPLVGTWLAFLVFGGEFPSPDITSRLYTIHILLVPGLLFGLLGAHLAVLWHQKHTQFPGPGRTEDNIEGSHLWPTYALLSLGLFAAVFALLAFLGGVAQINPIWLYGPFKPAAVTTAAQPDWYMGWLEGALRLFPAWRIRLLDHTISEAFWPGVVLPSLTFLLFYAWPFVEARVTGDHEDHELLDRPRDRPVRTPIGASVLTFYFVLFLAGSQDIIAQKLGVAIDPITWTFRVLVFLLPGVVFMIARKVCIDLQGADRQEARKDEIRRRVPTGSEEGGDGGDGDRQPEPALTD